MCSLFSWKATQIRRGYYTKSDIKRQISVCKCTQIWKMYNFWVKIISYSKCLVVVSLANCKKLRRHLIIKVGGWQHDDEGFYCSRDWCILQNKWLKQHLRVEPKVYGMKIKGVTKFVQTWLMYLKQEEWEEFQNVLCLRQ